MPFKRYLTDEQRKASRKASYRKWKIKTGYKWREKFPEKAKASEKDYQERNKVKIYAQQKAWLDKNPGKRSEYSARWQDKNPEWQPEYNKTHKEQLAAARRKRERQRKQEDPGFKILCNLKRRVNTALHRAKTKKTINTKPLLGCDIYSFITYIESKFEPDMSWSNYGRKKGIRCWELDHIIPLALFSMTNLEHQKAAFHFSNYQPLWAKDNADKLDSATPEQVEYVANLKTFTTPHPGAQPQLNSAVKSAQ